MVVWETTDARPALRIARTTVFVEGVDGGTGRLQLRREDVVESAGDRVYLGGADRRTLRLPTPDGAVAVDAQQSFDGSAELEQGVVVTTQPLRPGQTTVRTRLLVQYDVRGGEYALRVTAPLPMSATCTAPSAIFAVVMLPSARSAVATAPSTIFAEFHALWPDRFINITNGITPRRWLRQANPALSSLVTSALGDGWIHGWGMRFAHDF